MEKKYNSQATIEKILSVSAELFLEKGFEKTSMQDIARKAGISKGGIYHHFNSKDEVIEAVTKNQEKVNHTIMETWLSEIEGLNGREKLTAILEKSIESQEAHYLDNLMSIRMKSAEFVLSYMQDCVNKDSALVSQIISQGVKDGSLVTDYPEESGEVFLLLLNVWCDPCVFQCSYEKLTVRLKFLQHMMQSIGLDVLSDELLGKTLDLLEKLYRKENYE